MPAPIKSETLLSGSLSSKNQQQQQQQQATAAAVIRKLCLQRTFNLTDATPGRHRRVDDMMRLDQLLLLLLLAPTQLTHLHREQDKTRIDKFSDMQRLWAVMEFVVGSIGIGSVASRWVPCCRATTMFSVASAHADHVAVAQWPRLRGAENTRNGQSTEWEVQWRTTVDGPVTWHCNNDRGQNVIEVRILNMYIWLSNTRFVSEIAVIK